MERLSQCKLVSGLLLFLHTYERPSWKVVSFVVPVFQDVVFIRTTRTPYPSPTTPPPFKSSPTPPLVSPPSVGPRCLPPENIP